MSHIATNLCLFWQDAVRLPTARRIHPYGLHPFMSCHADPTLSVSPAVLSSFFSIKECLTRRARRSALASRLALSKTCSVVGSLRGWMTAATGGGMGLVHARRSTAA